MSESTTAQAFSHITPPEKITILIKPAAGAPPLNIKKFAVAKDYKVSYLHDRLKKFLKMEPSDDLYLYLCQSFQPTVDMIFGDLYRCFQSDKKLIFHYAQQPAF